MEARPHCDHAGFGLARPLHEPPTMKRNAVLLVFVASCAGGAPDGGSDDSGPDDCRPYGSPMAPADLSGLPTCCEEAGGAGHCVDSDHVAAGVVGTLSACSSGGVCAPDQDLMTGGVYTRTSCTSIVGPGACVSVCLADVAANKDTLTQDVCADGERCAPCIDPRDNSPTGLCEPAAAGCDDDPNPTSGCDDPSTCAYDVGCPPVLDVSSLTACAPDAHCFDKSLIPTEEQGRFSACAGGTTLCIPDVFLTTGGKFELASCHSLYGGEGRCVSRALPDIGAQADTLPQDTCTADQRCAPCFSPIDGTDTGLCHLSCDAGPQEPPTLAPTCCHDVGTCIPSSSVPADEAGQLAQDACETDQLCVPDSFITGSPLVTCEAAMIGLDIGEGRCLPDCLAQTGGINGALMTGDCSAAGSGFKCFPCTDPLSGAPTGLCTM